MTYTIIESRPKEGYDLGIMDDGRKIYIFHNSIIGAEKMQRVSEGLAMFKKVIRGTKLEKAIDSNEGLFK